MCCVVITMYTRNELQTIVVFIASLISVSLSFDFDGSSSSYAKFSPWVPCQNGSISFEFRTQTPNAILLYTDSGGVTNDYYQLKLVNGIMHLQFKLQDATNMLSAGKNLHDNQWHVVDIIREGKLTTLKVDGETYTRESKQYNPENIEILENKYYIFIGGLPTEYTDDSSELAHELVIYEPRLRGAVRNLFYSNCGQAMFSPEMVDSAGIVLDNDLCLQSSPCHNNGICVSRDHGVQCDCSWTDFVGEYCDTEKLPTEATFQGSQYLMYDLTMRGDPIFSRRDVLTLHFKTTHGDGLLFYTGEGRDYMTVFLKNGVIYVSMDLGSGPYNEAVGLNGYKLDDGQWHKVVVSRDSRQISIRIDGQEQATGTTAGEFTMLSSNLLYVGGSPITSNLPGSQLRTNFRGCMKKVEYKADSIELDLIELARLNHDLISVVGDVVFGKCEDIVDARPVTFTTPESFVALPRWDVSRAGATISFQFQTVEPDGLIMYNSGSYGAKTLDFFAFEILDGYLFLVLDLGTGAVKEKISRTRVDDGNPHLVYFHYGGKTGYITVDGHQTEYISQGDGLQLDLEELLFIGGINFERHNSYRLPKEVWSGVLRHGFVGCFQDLLINEQKINLKTIADAQLQPGIVSECQRKLDSHCISRPCMHNGVCSEGWNRFVCDCTATSYTGTTCGQVTPTLQFDGVQYVLVSLPEESFNEAEDISLRFKTVHESGILLMTQSAQSDDTMELYLESGHLRFNLNLGAGSKTLTIGHALNDDQWHTVVVKRRGQKMTLRVDKGRAVTDIIPNIATTVQIVQIVLGSVGPMLSDITPDAEDVLNVDDVDIGMQNDNSLQHHTGFVGAMQQFVFNGNHYFSMSEDGHKENVEITARFEIGESITRDPVTFKSRESYVMLQQLQANKHFAVYFRFKTAETSGLILYNGRYGHDFLALELYQGYLYYIYDMGGGSQRIRVNTPEKLNDNKWHDVSLLRPQMEQQLIRVDDNPSTVENMKDYSARRFDLMGPLYLGGVVKTLYNALPMHIYSKYGFQGCIASLELNGYAFNILNDATLVEYAVVDGCTTSDMTCHSNSCFNGGRCIQQWNSYECDCDLTSFSGPTCTEESTTYKFGLGRGLIIFEHYADARPSTNGDTLSLGFQTIQDFAVLVRIDSADSDDFIEMELVQGNILVVYNMGQLDLPIGEAYHKVNDGNYHVIKFTRHGANATLQVDNWNRAMKNPKGKQMTVFNNQSRLWIGGRKDEAGNINNAFSGTMSGFVFNGEHIFDYLINGDPRVRIEGNVSLLNTRSRDVRPDSEKNTGIQSTQGVKITTPQQVVAGDIFSGSGPRCYSDDGEECITIESDTESEDDIIKATTVITRLPTVESGTDGTDKNTSCKDCDPQGTELIKPSNGNGYTTYPYGTQNTVNPGGRTPDPREPRQTKNKKGDSDHLNIFLIVGIAAGVLVALLILVIALYKFRSRDEGSYRVDESQNFAYIEAKKSQTNGSVTATKENGKTGGKKKDVKEWYV